MPIGILAGDSGTMILSSADILRILGGNEIIRLSADIAIVDGRPGLSGREGIYIHIERFPAVDEFEATWSIYIESDEEVDLVVAEIKRLLPRVEVQPGLLTVVKTTDFRSDSTQIAPKASKPEKAQVDLSHFEERFQSLVEDVQDQMLLVSSGRPGKDGKDGADGLNGRDGRDLLATEAELFDLQDVERGIPLQKGQVLTWSGTQWTNLYVPQMQAIFSGGGGSGDGEGVIISDTAPSTREDGSALQEGDQWWDSTTGVMYVWYVDADSGQWVQSSGGGGGGGATTLAGLLDTDTSGVQDGEILVYRSATGNWTAEAAPATGLQSGDNISELTNDAGYITAAEVPPTGVTQLLAGDNITIDPADGTGVVTVNATLPTGGGTMDGGNFNTGVDTADGTALLDGGLFT